MKIYEFMSLSEQEKGEAVNNGFFVGHRFTQKEAITLYCLGSFFVELVYTKDHSEFIRFRAFRKVELLEPYLSQLPSIDLF